jgi:glycine/D-amino acid oxidase-like deaminating enzyme
MALSGGKSETIIVFGGAIVGSFVACFLRESGSGGPITGRSEHRSLRRSSTRLQGLPT